MHGGPDIHLTAGLLAFCVIGAALCFWLGSRKHDKLEPRMVPWMFIAFGFVATTFILVIHLVNLAGVETGNGGFGRR